MPTPKRSISSRVAKQNPRPRKYATAAERQKALRERFPTLCVRVEQEQADFMKRIADEQGRTLQDVHLAFIKYAGGRGNLWLTQGLKGFAPLPRFEETPKENPMKRKPTPAQIAARERFAEMARSGAFKRSKTRKKNPLTYGLDGVVNITDTYMRSIASSLGLAEHYANQLRMRGRDDIVYVVFGITPEAKAQAGRLRRGVTITLNPRDYEIAYALHPTRGDISRELKAQRDAERRAYTRQGMTLKRNPAKKTVSQKISQLTREGYPQKQAVAIALNEEREGKVKRNPAPRGFVKADDYTIEVFNKYGMKPYDAIYMQTKGGRGEPIYDLTILKHENGKYLAAHGSVIVKQEFDRAGDAAAYLEEWYINNREPAARRTNPRAANPIILVSDKPIKTRRKGNPAKPKSMTVYQVQYRRPGMKLFEPWMTVMYLPMAKDIARRLADDPVARGWTIKVESLQVKS